MVALRRAVEPSLRQLGCARNLSVLQAPSADHAFRVIQRLRPRVVIAEVSQSEDEMFGLLRWLADGAQPICVIAVATTHDDGTERATWRARATCYVPQVEAHVLDQALEAALVE